MQVITVANFGVDVACPYQTASWALQDAKREATAAGDPGVVLASHFTLFYMLPSTPMKGFRAASFLVDVRLSQRIWNTRGGRVGSKGGIWA